MASIDISGTFRQNISPKVDWYAVHPAYELLRAHKASQMGFIVEVLFFWSTCFTKVSVLMFYRRLVEGTLSKKFRLAIWAAS
jgi:hypothetical protein